jgi:hypothetical protein
MVSLSFHICGRAMRDLRQYAGTRFAMAIAIVSWLDAPLAFNRMIVELCVTNIGKREARR